MSIKSRISVKKLINIKLLVFDFDGVFTDNRVILDQKGFESVICNRSDGLGISLLKKFPLDIIVISTETNPVVAKRCKKLKLEFYQGISNKLVKLKKICSEKNLDLSNVAFVGNDVNDLECLSNVEFSFGVNDSHPDIIDKLDYITDKKGGYGAVREICDIFISLYSKK